MRFPQFVQFTQATGTQKRDVKGEEASKIFLRPLRRPRNSWTPLTANFTTA